MSEDVVAIRADMLRRGQRIQWGRHDTWVKITGVDLIDGRIVAEVGDYWPRRFAPADVVEVRHNRE